MNGEVLQWVDERLDSVLTFLEMSNGPAPLDSASVWMHNEINRPFLLTEAPLYPYTRIKISEDRLLGRAFITTS